MYASSHAVVIAANKRLLCVSDGYVPADLFGDLPFYLALSCAYVIIGVTWAILCAVFR